MIPSHGPQGQKPSLNIPRPESFQPGSHSAPEPRNWQLAQTSPQAWPPQLRGHARKVPMGSVLTRDRPAPMPTPPAPGSLLAALRARKAARQTPQPTPLPLPVSGPLPGAPLSPINA